ncbi:MAG: hypothetical protein ACYSP9_08625 [Planctomycetota bacterium]|jgi:hypothetical protein
MFNSAQRDKVLGPVVGQFAIDVMCALLWIKQAAKLLFKNKSVLKDVASAIAERVIRHIYLNVAVAVHKATTFPFMAFWAFCRRVAAQEFVMLSLSLAPARSIARIFGCDFAAATLALPFRVRRRNNLPHFFIHFLCFWRSRVVAPNKAFPFIRDFATTAFAFNHFLFSPQETRLQRHRPDVN